MMVNHIKKSIALIFVAGLALLLLVIYGSFQVEHKIGTSSIKAENTPLPSPTRNWINNEMSSIETQANNLDPEVLKISLVAYQHAVRKEITNNPYLTIVDYSKPSTERRLWVVDLQDQKVLFNTFVAHGKNSGGLYATSFSNAPESLKSSLGVFLTEDIYSGKHGESLRIEGLEPGTNNNAFDRDIVVHGADYVSAAIAKTGRLGRSWGCLAVDPNIVKPLVQTIQHKGLVVAYYPDQHWLKNSSFLT